MDDKKRAPLVSVIVPVYNAETTLKRCLDSLLIQTYKHIEVILVNDGSQDNSATICKAYCRKHENFRLLEQNNSGPSTARNNGIDHSNGKYVYFVDADDYVDHRIIEMMLRAAEEHSAEMVICNYYIEKSNHEIKKHEYECESKLYYGKEYQVLCLNLINDVSEGRIPPYSWIRMILRSSLESPRIRYKDGLIRSEDFHFFVSLQFRLSKVYVINEPLYYYVELHSSVTHRYVPKYWDTVKFIYKDLCDTLPNLQTINRRLDIMFIQRTLIALNNSCRVNDNSIFKSEMMKIIKDDLLMEIIQHFTWSEGIKKFGFFYMLMKLKMYPIIEKYYKIKFKRNGKRG